MPPTLALFMLWALLSSVVQTGGLQGPDKRLQAAWDGLVPLANSDALEAVPVPEALYKHSNEVVVGATLCPQPLGRGYDPVINTYNSLFERAQAAYPAVKHNVTQAVGALPQPLPYILGIPLGSLSRAVEANRDRLAAPQPAWLTHYVVLLKTAEGTTIKTDVGANPGTPPRVLNGDSFDLSNCYDPHTFSGFNRTKTLQQVHAAASAWYKYPRGYSVGSVFRLASGTQDVLAVYSCQSYAMGVLAFVGAQGVLASSYGATAGVMDMVLVIALSIVLCTIATLYTLATASCRLRGVGRMWRISLLVVATIYLAAVALIVAACPHYRTPHCLRMVVTVLGFLAVLAVWPVAVGIALWPLSLTYRFTALGAVGGMRLSQRLQARCHAAVGSIVGTGTMARKRSLHGALAVCTPAMVACGTIQDAAAWACTRCLACRAPRPRVGPATWAQHTWGSAFRCSVGMAMLGATVLMLYRSGQPRFEVGAFFVFKQVQAASLPWIAALVLLGVGIGIVAAMALAPLVAPVLIVIGVVAQLATMVAALPVELLVVTIWMLGCTWFLLLVGISFVLHLGTVVACALFALAGMLSFAPVAVVFAHNPV